MASKSATVVRDVAEGVATFSCPFSRFGIVPIGGRSTAIRLQGPGASGGAASGSGGVWVLASTPLDGETKSKLQEMGDVKYIVAGDLEHHLFIEDYAKAYPSAKVVGVEGMEAKHPAVNFAGLYGRDDPATKYGFEDEIQTHYFPTFSNKDVVFMHKATKSLIVTDLLFNLPCIEQYKKTPAGKPTSWVPFLGGMTDRLKPDSPFHANFLYRTAALNDFSSWERKQNGNKTTSADERRTRFAKDAEMVASWDFERVIPSHGEVIETGGRKSWIQAFTKFLTPEGKAKV